MKTAARTFRTMIITLAMIGIISTAMVGAAMATTVSIGDITSCNNDFSEVTLPIVVTNATNVGSMQIVVTYNSSLVRAASATNGNMDVMNCYFGDGYIITNTYQNGSVGMDGTFIFANITFVPIANGDCSLTIDNYAECYDATYNTTPIALVMINGEYNSTGYMLGDVNGNGAINVGDAMVLAKHLIGISGFENIQEGTADVNRDGVIDAADVTYLARALLGDMAYPMDFP